MEKLQAVTDWVKARFAERSTWDGTVILGISVLALIASPIVKYAAIAGAAYGVYRILQQEDII